MKLILHVLGLLLILFLFVRYFEHAQLYFPTKHLGMNPQHAGLSYEDVYVQTPDRKLLHGWFINNDKAKYVVLFCHGNGGNISDRLGKLRFLHELGLSVIIFDYRGYGRSSGRPSEYGLYIDSEAVYDYLVKRKKIDGKNIILYGESLGGAVAVNMAEKFDTAGVIVESSFTSVTDMAKIVFPWLPGGLIWTRFDSVNKIANVKCPVLIFHSPEDEMIPFWMGERLYNAAKARKKLVRIYGTHNAGIDVSRAIMSRAIREFFL